MRVRKDSSSGVNAGHNRTDREHRTIFQIQAGLQPASGHPTRVRYPPSPTLTSPTHSRAAETSAASLMAEGELLPLGVEVASVGCSDLGLDPVSNDHKKNKIDTARLQSLKVLIEAHPSTRMPLSDQMRVSAEAWTEPPRCDVSLQIAADQCANNEVYLVTGNRSSPQLQRLTS
ncbi:hypothetical protein RRG08_025884 [Elysia crispata]|uniref:Uncharacterized protein n=1 Tax=Elysia crispata TaxID=231223 RepID=A0AAE1DKY6_9GAST|nr:hypothetical protein RRG08_025884 [Elysia crispata]